MDPITTVMRQCRLFDGIPEEKYQNVLAGRNQIVS